MTDFVLVHGAWHGGWCWDKLRPLLEAQGHRVLAPTLTGLGDRAAELTPAVGLETHVRDIADVLASKDLHEVVLVAHSYAGVPVTVVADRCPERIAAVIYLDSGRPRDGQSANDVFPGSDEQYAHSVANDGDGWRIPVPPDETFGITDVDDLAWVRARLTPQPLKTFTDAATLRSDPPAVASGAIICTLDGTADSAAARSLGAMPTAWIAAGHDVMVTDPPLVAASLAEVLRQLR